MRFHQTARILVALAAISLIAPSAHACEGAGKSGMAMGKGFNMNPMMAGALAKQQMGGFGGGAKFQGMAGMGKGMGGFPVAGKQMGGGARFGKVNGGKGGVQK